LRGISFVTVPIIAVWLALGVWLGRKQQVLAEAKSDQTLPLAAAPEAA
jgi:hypothetical protein